MVAAVITKINRKGHSMIKTIGFLTSAATICISITSWAAKEVVHDAEHYILIEQIVPRKPNVDFPE